MAGTLNSLSFFFVLKLVHCVPGYSFHEDNNSSDKLACRIPAIYCLLQLLSSQHSHSIISSFQLEVTVFTKIFDIQISSQLPLRELMLPCHAHCDLFRF